MLSPWDRVIYLDGFLTLFHLTHVFKRRYDVRRQKGKAKQLHAYEISTGMRRQTHHHPAPSHGHSQLLNPLSVGANDGSCHRREFVGNEICDHEWIMAEQQVNSDALTMYKFFVNSPRSPLDVCFALPLELKAWRACQRALCQLVQRGELICVPDHFYLLSFGSLMRHTQFSYRYWFSFSRQNNNFTKISKGTQRTS